MHQLLRTSSRAARYSFAAFLLTLFALSTGNAQTFRGGINGTVTDKTGAAIANATVIAVQTDTDVKHTTTSSSGGEFLFQDLPLGNYSITVSFPGFQTVKTDKISVLAGVIYTLPVSLPLSTSATTVEVDAAAVALDTTTTTQTTVLNAKAVADLPLNGPRLHSDDLAYTRLCRLQRRRLWFPQRNPRQPDELADRRRRQQ